MNVFYCDIRSDKLLVISLQSLFFRNTTPTYWSRLCDWFKCTCFRAHLYNRRLGAVWRSWVRKAVDRRARHVGTMRYTTRVVCCCDRHVCWVRCVWRLVLSEAMCMRTVVWKAGRWHCWRLRRNGCLLWNEKGEVVSQFIVAVHRGSAIIFDLHHTEVLIESSVTW
jgi:hypothetical protein